MLTQSVRREPDKPAFAYYDGTVVRQVSYSRFYAAICRMARCFAELGLPAGSRAVLTGPNGPHWAAACLGLHFAGLSVAPLDAELPEDQLANIVSILEPAAAVCLAGQSGRFKGLGHVLDLKAVDFSPGEESFDPRLLATGQPFSIVFTSGSTGTPKGVMLIEANLLHNVQTVLSAPGLLSGEDVILNLLPLHHVYAFSGTLLAPLAAGCTIVYPRSLKPKDISTAAVEQGCTIMAVVPRVVQSIHERVVSTLAEKSLPARVFFRLLKAIGSVGIERGWRPGRFIFRSAHRPFGRLRVITCGGAKLDAALHREMAALGFRIFEAYGLTETAPVVTLNRVARPVFGSVGRPAPGVQLRLEKTSDTLEDSEVLVRGPNVMAGYWRLPEETAKAFREGWFLTGDLGRLDDHGNLFLTGRSKDVIVLSSGKNIYPEELEELYSRSELVEEVCVCLLKGLGREQLTAVVYPSRQALERLKVINIYDELRSEIEFIAIKLPSYQRVTRVMLTDEPFPRTRLGKLKRYQIMERLATGEKSAAEEADKSGREADQLLLFARKALKLERIPSGRENLELDLGIDSLTKLDFLASFERQFGVSLSDEQAGSLVQLDDLRPYLVTAAVAPAAEPGRKRDEMILLEELVELEDSRLGNTMRFWARLKLRFVFRIFFRMRVTGMENLPQEGAYIIAPNHVSYIDGLLVHAALPWGESRRLFSVATADIFDRWPFSQISYRARIIKTGTLETTARSLLYSQQILASGRPLCLFPEGKRSFDGRVDSPKPGMARLALSCRVPVIPVYLRGTEKFMSRMHPGLALARIDVEFLPPIPPEGSEEEILSRWTESIRGKEARL